MSSAVIVSLLMSSEQDSIYRIYIVVAFFPLNKMLMNASILWVINNKIIATEGYFRRQVLIVIYPGNKYSSFLVSYRIAVFSVSVLHDERIVIVAEQRPDSTEEDSFQWMSRVLQVMLLMYVWKLLFLFLFFQLNV